MGSQLRTAWQVFQIYNLYRLHLIALFFIFKLFLIFPESYLTKIWSIAYYITIGAYAFCVVFFLWSGYTQRYEFKGLVLNSSFVDLLFLNLFIIYLGDFESGIGILLNIALVALAILLPGISAVFFAAIESILLLSFSTFRYLTYGENSFFYVGLLGAGLFATAITGLYLSKWLKSNQEIAQQRRKALRSLRKINEYLIQRLQTPILFINEKQDIIFANEIALKLFNITSDNLPIALAEIDSELYRYHCNYQAAGYRRSTNAIQLTQRDLSLSYLSYQAESGQVAVFILDDPKLMMQQVTQLKLASLGRLTASISHELRNPLGAISHASQLIQEAKTLTPEVRRLNEIIYNNTQRMNELIKNVLQLSRQQKSKPTLINLYDFLIQLIKEDPYHQQLSFTIQVPKSLNIYFDRSQLHQLMVILGENIIKYGRNEQDRAIIHVEAFKKKQSFMELYVYDEGVGIPTEMQHTIFEPFFTTTRSGVGLGLFIAKELCTANQAIIKVADSKKSKGACFKISFLHSEGDERGGG